MKNLIRQTRKLLKGEGLVEEYNRLLKLLRSMYSKPQLIIYKDWLDGYPEKTFYTIELTYEAVYKGDLTCYELEYMHSSDDLSDLLREVEDFICIRKS